MKTIRVEINDKLAAELDALLRDGFFNTEEEAIRFALIRLIESHEAVLTERFQRDDISWALKQKKAG
jgi:Arc/MetJ-type ribon-helix-helix transcriptional regulator